MEVEPIEENDNMEIENFLEKAPTAKEKEDLQCRISPLSHSYPDMRDNFPEPAESSRRNEGAAEIMVMLRLMKNEMEEREKKWERR